MSNCLFSSIISILRIVKHYPSKRLRLECLSATFKSNFYVIANGPSLSEHLSELENVRGNVAVVNMFAFSRSLFFNLKPSIYVFADDFFWKDNNNLDSQSLLQRDELFRILHEVDWPMTIYLPINGYKKGGIQSAMSDNVFITYDSFCTNHFEGYEFLRMCAFKNNFAMPLLQTVLVAALYIVINHGYRHINLYGADLSWIKSLCVNADNVICHYDRHFYDGAKDVYMIPVAGKKNYRIHEYLYDLANMFKGCCELRDYADYMGCSIINHNEESFIDAFEKCK